MLIGNYSVLQKTPCRYFGGSTVSVEPQVRSNYSKSGHNRDRFYQDQQTTAYHFYAVPGGDFPPHTFIMPQGANGIKSINGIGAGATVTANLQVIASLSATLHGTGTMTGVAQLQANIMNTIVDGTLTFQQAMELMLAALAGKVSGAAGTTITFRNPADTKNRIVATVDASGNRTALTYDLT